MKRKNQRDVVVNVRFTSVAKEALEKAAADDTRAVSALISKIASDWLKEKGYLK